MHFNSEDIIDQMKLLNKYVSRGELKKALKPLTPRMTLNIRIERNLPFEYIGNLLNPLLGVWSSEANITYSDYDSSFSKTEKNSQTNLIIFWVDWREYCEKMHPQEAVEWIKGRIYSINPGNRKVLINNWPESLDYKELMFDSLIGKRNWFKSLNVELYKEIGEIPSCEVLDIALISQIIGINSYDGRNEQVSNYPFSNIFTIEVARHLALRILPVLFKPRIKALVLDLDDTLYSGVLGESRLSDLIISEGHKALYELLLKLKENGTLLTLCSRNEEQDVKHLLENNKDLKLSWDDFAVIYANWEPKPDNIAAIANRLNIDTSAMLFIDDNISELTKAAAAHPELNLLLADPTGEETMHRIINYPGLYYMKKDYSASLRTVDVQSNQKREKIKSESSDFNSYLISLKMKIDIYENFTLHTERIYELSHKTNQFNLALKRISEQKSKEAIVSPKYETYTVNLSDVLSDSGIIGVFICRVDESFARFEEILFSCRALGRNIESVSLYWILRKLNDKGIEKIAFDVQKGLRNNPAIDWFKSFNPQAKREISIKEVISKLEGNVKTHPAEVIGHHE
jgi:FkbH-like protein